MKTEPVNASSCDVVIELLVKPGGPLRHCWKAKNLRYRRPQELRVGLSVELVAAPPSDRAQRELVRTDDR